VVRIDAVGDGFNARQHRMEQIFGVGGHLVVPHNPLFTQQNGVGMGAAHIEPDDH